MNATRGQVRSLVKGGHLYRMVDSLSHSRCSVSVSKSIVDEFLASITRYVKEVDELPVSVFPIRSVIKRAHATTKDVIGYFREGNCGTSSVSTVKMDIFLFTSTLRNLNVNSLVILNNAARIFCYCESARHNSTSCKIFINGWSCLHCGSRRSQ